VDKQTTLSLTTNQRTEQKDWRNNEESKGKGKGKAVIVLNQAPRHKDVWGGGIAPRILNLSSR